MKNALSLMDRVKFLPRQVSSYLDHYFLDHTLLSEYTPFQDHESRYLGVHVVVYDSSR